MSSAELRSTSTMRSNSSATAPSSGISFCAAKRPRALGEMAEPATNAEKGGQREHDHREIDDGGELDLGRRPIRHAEMRAREAAGGEGRDDCPAARCGLERRQRGDDLIVAVRRRVAEGDRQLAVAARGEAIEDALLLELLALEIEIRRRDDRLRRDVEETTAGRPEEQLDVGHAVGETGKLLADQRQSRVLAEQRQQRLREQMPLLAHAAQQQILLLLVRGFKLLIEDDRHDEENDGEQKRLRGQRAIRPSPITPNRAAARRR
jgi:hypothetical protein